MSFSLSLLGGHALTGANGALTGPPVQRHRMALLALLAKPVDSPSNGQGAIPGRHHRRQGQRLGQAAGEALQQAVKHRAFEHQRTVMMGRTHGVHAEPMTFGLKLALWYAELNRAVDRVERAREGICVGKISGAVGTFAHLDPEIEADVCRRLGLESTLRARGRPRKAEKES